MFSAFPEMVAATVALQISIDLIKILQFIILSLLIISLALTFVRGVARIFGVSARQRKKDEDKKYKRDIESMKKDTQLDLLKKENEVLRAEIIKRDALASNLKNSSIIKPPENKKIV